VSFFSLFSYRRVELHSTRLFYVSFRGGPQKRPNSNSQQKQENYPFLALFNLQLEKLRWNEFLLWIDYRGPNWATLCESAEKCWSLPSSNQAKRLFFCIRIFLGVKRIFFLLGIAKCMQATFPESWLLCSAFLFIIIYF